MHGIVDFDLAWSGCMSGPGARLRAPGSSLHGPIWPGCCRCARRRGPTGRGPLSPRRRRLLHAVHFLSFRVFGGLRARRGSQTCETATQRVDLLQSSICGTSRSRGSFCRHRGTQRVAPASAFECRHTLRVGAHDLRHVGLWRIIEEGSTFAAAEHVLGTGFGQRFGPRGPRDVAFSLESAS